MKNKLGLIAAFTKDSLFDKEGNLVKIQKGGPAYFMSKVFVKNNFPYSAISNPELTVQITVADGEEIGKITPITPIKIDFSNIKEPNLLISSILNEFDLKEIVDYNGKIYMDMQGFIRVPNSMERKNWVPSQEIRNSVFCLKISDYELPLVDNTFVKKQKKKILLLTQGKKGSVMWVFGKSYNIKAPKIPKTRETIGAGDTFLANFVCKYIQTENPLESAEFATAETGKFLLAKSKL